MNEVAAAEKILDTMLTKLGFQVEYEQTSTEDGPCLNILTDQGAHLIGKNGSRLEDLQYLMNRILNRHYPEAARVKVDCDHYRAQQETELVETARDTALQVLEDGKPRRLQPLNAYYRRIAHNAMADIEGIKTSSPKASARYKRIQIEKI
ncbi:hypothetical protein JIN77_09500 [Verrucomicrobiaceae bacterium R5-34]|nr:hypothetical protein [Verrucomicrobiaceae bacterium R5-34]